MEYPAISHFVAALIDEAAALIPEYMQRKEDSIKAKNGTAICIIDAQGRVYGKMFGEDRIMARERYRVAWMKASQVWITGMPTGEFERLAFNGEIDEAQFGIKRPDYIGWEGGQPVHLPDGTILAVGFSGFTSASDLEIVKRALEANKRSW
jgi:glc operon protein GlcG